MNINGIEFIQSDLVGKWKIIQNKLIDYTDDKQNEIDVINKEYIIEYLDNGHYMEYNNGMLQNRLIDLNGEYILENDKLIMTIRTYNFIRTYIIINYSQDKSQLKLKPCDTLFCDIYSNIEYMIIEKT